MTIQALAKQLNCCVSQSPLEQETLKQMLYLFGFHQRDIFDAFNQARENTANLKYPLFELKRNSK
jgi:hypothetical protein